ncbi:MAG: N-acyl homoserine lactonase family protein [Thermoplasmata archaeon]|nr:N-acyl homoserine lactonase family protein [Thermoplasmata archaeon]
MSTIKIHVLHTGEVCVSPYLPYGDGAGTMKAAGVGVSKEDRLWIPVSAYLIEHPKGLFLFDTGWDRSMSPEGVFDRKAQIKSLGSRLLYMTNQGRVPAGEAVGEQLAAMGVSPSDLDIVLISHLDCDHANGLPQVKGAKRIIVSADEMAFANGGPAMNRVRYQDIWWRDSGIETFEWNGTEGPFGKSYDVLGDGSLVMVNIRGHADGQCALRITGEDGRYVLLFADGGYSTRSWKEQIMPGICADPESMRKSLAWIRDASEDPNCVESMANHDPDIAPHVVELRG